MEIGDQLNKYLDEVQRSHNDVGEAKQRFKKFIREAYLSKIDPHRGAYEKLGRSNIVPILFMDIVGYSKLKGDHLQKYAIDLLNRLVRKALRGAHHELNDVVSLPTGDGMCLCFNTGTDSPLIVAAKVQRELSKQKRGPGKPRIQVRMGVHAGNVLRVRDLKGSYNLAGAAINISQRAMNCGDQGHILCTKEAFVLLNEFENYKTRIKPIKERFIVKHGFPLKLYNYYRPGEGVGNRNEPVR